MKVVILGGHGGFTVTQGLNSFFGAENVSTLIYKDLLNILDPQSNPSGKNIPDLLVLPGGSSQKMGEEFGPAGKAALRERVREGMNVIGICAGAALGASATIFAPIGPYPKLMRQASERFALLPVTAIGPLPPPEGYKGPYSQGVETIVGCNITSAPLQVYYGGGCSFRIDQNPDGSQPSVEVLAHFGRLVGGRNLAEVKNKASAAIVCGKFGKGKVMLSGIHPDVKWEHMAHMADRLRSNKFQLRSGAQPGHSEDFMNQSMQSVILPENEEFFKKPSEWFHDLLLREFTGCEPLHRYADDTPSLGEM
jgi:glutamine amidotransferase-like uncharacterized protein